MLTQVDLALEKAAQTCGACAAKNVIDLRKIRLGLVLGGRQNPDLIALPACSCGAQETLVRTFDQHFASCQPSPHHLVVNLLAEHLRGAGRVPEELQLQFAGETRKAHGVAELGSQKQFTPASLAKTYFEHE